MLLPTLADPSDTEAIRFGERVLSHRQLATVASGLGRSLGSGRVAVWARPTIETCVAVVAALGAAAPVVPINPKVGERELEHILADSMPELVIAAPGDTLPDGLATLPRIDVDLTANGGGRTASEPSGEAPAFVVYTSGTTGPPKGVVLPRRAISSNLDALAEAWEWTSDDVVTHGLPLFHVHGLIIGVLGPLRRGGAVRHLGTFSTRAAAAELAGPATMMFGVPTMYHRLAADIEADPELAKSVSAARLLVSGSAALPAICHERIARATGQRIVERYGMTETLMNCSVRASGERRPGTVGPALDGVELRLVDDVGAPITDSGPAENGTDETIGEIEVRGPNLFLEYLNRPDATAEAFHDGWFRTGDMATRTPDGYVRIVGRRATDIIKSGGFKIGAGEVENALLEHPDVAEVAVAGRPDDDLGERIVAWVVPSAARPTAEELTDHVARLLTPHKRPRTVHFVEALPRNELGKVRKRDLR